MAYANFLKVHYKGVKTMPGNETDGCEPEVSPFEIAAQSWQTFDMLYRQTSDKQWAGERDNVEKLAAPYKPENMIDLNWKIHFLATIGREKYSKELDALIDQLYSYERPDGMWPYPFDKQARPADFISYHAILALALAGRRPETDQPLARAVDACLKAQRPEGSWEGDPDYQGFNTPFRATQVALMAWALRMILSRRQDAAPGGRALLAAALRSPDARRRWGATRLFNQHFKYLTDDPELLRTLTERLNDPVPSVRFQAASGLWRWYYWKADDRDDRTGVLEALATRLNTETDGMVRRGLHESIYDVLDENTGYMEAWIRTASTQEDKDVISKGYEAVVRDQAVVLARVLRNSTALGREGILTALWDFHTRHMALPTLKENTVSIGLPDVFNKYVSGVPDLHRPGYEYPPYRETVNFNYDVRNGFYQTRVGNDSDLIHFFRSSGPELEESLIQCLKGADTDMKIDVLKAGSTLSGAGDAKFALAALKL